MIVELISYRGSDWWPSLGMQELSYSLKSYSIWETICAKLWWINPSSAVSRSTPEGTSVALLKFRITSTIKHSRRIDFVTAEPTGIRLIMPISFKWSFCCWRVNMKFMNSYPSSSLSPHSSDLRRQNYSKDCASAPNYNFVLSDTVSDEAASIAVTAFCYIAYSRLY